MDWRHFGNLTNSSLLFLENKMSLLIFDKFCAVKFFPKEAERKESITRIS